MRNPLTIIGGVVTLFAILMTGVIILTSTGDTVTASAKIVILNTLIVAIVGAIPGIMALQKSEATQHDLHNGVLKGKMKDAVQEMIDDPENPLTLDTKEGDSNG